MIKARIRWCTCRVENILTLGKLLSLWFCFLLHSILFFISQTSYRTYKIMSSYELARPVMGTIFLVYGHFQSIFYSTRKMVPLRGERAQSLKVFNVRMLYFKNKIEMRKRRQNNYRPINLPQGNTILHILHVYHLTQNFISRAYNNCCVAMYAS